MGREKKRAPDESTIQHELSIHPLRCIITNSHMTSQAWMQQQTKYTLYSWWDGFQHKE